MSEAEDTISMHMNNKSIWNVVNILGQSVPIEMALRELVQNGFEACDRYETSLEKYVRVNKDTKGNITITNYGGDFFSRDAAVKNLATLGNSGNSSNIASNFGIGAKISVLANNHEICYSSKKENEKNGISFTIGSIGPEDYGLKDFKDSSFSAKYNRNSVTSATIISGIGNTWNTLNEAVSPNKGVSGWGVAKFLSNRYFRAPYKIEVATYNKEGKNSKYRRVHGLQHCMKVTKRYASFKLVGDKIPEGVTAHWCILSDKRDNRNKLLSDYFIGFSLKNELLSNLDDSFQSRTIDFTRCGVYSNASRLVVVFELPEDSGCIWTADRSTIICNSKEIRKEDFYTAFKKQMPEKIKALQIEEEYELDMDKVRSDLAKELKDFFMPSLGPPPSTGGKKGENDEDENDTSSSTSSSGDTVRFSLSKMPKLEDSNNKDAPIVSYLVESNTIVVNHESPNFKLRKKNILENSNKDYSLLSDSEISGNIREEIYRGAVYCIAEFFKVNCKNLTPEEIEERLTPEALNCWSLPSIRAIRKRLTHRLNRAINSIDT